MNVGYVADYVFDVFDDVLYLSDDFDDGGDENDGDV